MMTNIRVEENRLFIGEDSFAFEKKLVSKLERFIRGITQKHPKEDGLLINEGKERHGKTNSSVAEAAYVKARTKREIFLFFTLESMMNVSRKTKEKINILDEPSLDSLSKDQLRNVNKDMERLFMTIGSHRHLFIINYTKFWKFPEYIVVDRAQGMVHMRTDKLGRFQYIRMKNLETLWNEKRVKNKRSYGKFSSFGGVMPNIMEEYFDELGITIVGYDGVQYPNATYKDYEREKDKAIASIGVKPKSIKDNKRDQEILIYRKWIANTILNYGINVEEAAKGLRTGRQRFPEWRKIEIAEDPPVRAT